ncbi:MAG: glycosyltransferase [Desulfuromusa sp.]|nr:glycosyltransferase [Desulfuromusa sp.]
MLKVAQILAGAPQGGAENFYVRLVKGLSDSGHTEQKAFLRDHPHRLESLEDAGVPVAGFRFGGPLNFFDHRRYLRSLHDYRPDIVMTWMNRASRSTPKGDYKLICRLGHYYNLKYYRHSDYWIGITKGICEHLVKGGMPAERVFHITNFADETPVRSLPRESFATPKNAPLLLAAGRLHVNKGFDTLLQALVDIPDAILWLAGSGPEEQSLKQLCEKLGLDERVRFLGWRTDVAALMRTADLFVCPSRYEGLGSIVLESWVNQCPIVSTASGGPSELIEDGETGRLTPIDQPLPLAEAILDLLGDSEQRVSLKEKAEELYWKEYSKEVVVKQYEELYQKITR